MIQNKTDFWFGYVYLLKCGDQYKIGFSKKPRKRLRQLRTGSPHPIEAIHSLRTPHYKQIEKQLHAKFDSKRSAGEWFKLDDEDVAHIKSLNSFGFTPEQERQRAESDAQYNALQEAARKAEEDRKLAVLLSGAASGYGLGIIYDGSPEPRPFESHVERGRRVAEEMRARA